MHSLSEIESLTKKLSETRDELTKIVLTLQLKTQRLQDEAIPDIKRISGRTSIHALALHTAIDTSRDLFQRPRTVIFHGIKLGLRKGPGGIDWDDDEKVCDLITKHFPKAQADLLIQTTHKPIAKALNALEVSDLKKIGCRVKSTADEVIIAPADTAVDKLVSALLKDAVDQAQAEAA